MTSGILIFFKILFFCLIVNVHTYVFKERFNTIDPRSCVGTLLRSIRSYIYIVRILCVGLILPGMYLSYGLTCIVITQQQNTRYKKPCIHRMFYTYISTCLHNDRFSACRRLPPTQDAYGQRTFVF